MDNDNQAKVPKPETKFSQQIGAQAARKLKAQRGGKRSIWLGLAVSGLIGFSVTVPTLIGTALGIWLDRHYPTKSSWTLMLLLVGLLIGCFNAWHWMESQYKEIQEDADE